MATKVTIAMTPRQFDNTRALLTDFRKRLASQFSVLSTPQAEETQEQRLDRSTARRTAQNAMDDIDMLLTHVFS